MQQKTITTRSYADLLGITSSGLCLVHCLITPILFVSQLCAATHCHDAPGWWKMIDFSFLAVSFVAIHYSVRHTGKAWIKLLFRICWVLQLLVIVNENIDGIALPTGSSYLPALGLIALHAYNRRHHTTTHKPAAIA